MPTRSIEIPRLRHSDESNSSSLDKRLSVVAMAAIDKLQVCKVDRWGNPDGLTCMPHSSTKVVPSRTQEAIFGLLRRLLSQLASIPGPTVIIPTAPVQWYQWVTACWRLRADLRTRKPRNHAMIGFHALAHSRAGSLYTHTHMCVFLRSSDSRMESADEQKFTCSLT